jgi:phosphatidylglycerol lysyltransferase
MRNLIFYYIIIPMTLRPSAEQKRNPRAELDTDARLHLLKKFGMNPYSALLLYKEFSAYPLASTEGFIGYREGRKMLMVMGEPVCAPEDYRTALQEFMDYCREEKKAFIQICCGEQYRQSVKDMDLSTVCIGENFVFDAATYEPKGVKAKPARWASKRAVRAGVSVKEYDHHTQYDPDLEATLESVTQRWMEKNTRFTPHLNDLNIFEHRAIKRYFYAEVEGTPVAMISCLPIYGRTGYLLEDVVRSPDAPYGSIEYITLSILESLKSDGWNMATFGISPCLDASGLTGVSLVLAKIATWVADRMYRLHQLHHFRKKFHATYSEPVYALKYPRGYNLIDLVRILAMFSSDG